MITVLGADGSHSHNSKASSFLIDRSILIDAGNVIEGLGHACCNIEHLFISHTHFDHVLDLPFILENHFSCSDRPLKVYALDENIITLREHLLNWDIWPDFEKIELERADRPVLEFVPVGFGDTIVIDGVEITVLKANHTVPACGYKVQKGSQAFVLSGDTYCNDALIDLIDSDSTITSLLIDVSFSSEKEELASKSKHLTPRLLETMLSRLRRQDVMICTYHQKPFFVEKIDRELTELDLLSNGGKRLETGDILDLFTPIQMRQDVENVQIGTSEGGHLKNLFKIAQTMQTEQDPSHLLEMIVDQAKNFTTSDGVTLYMLDAEVQELVFKISHNDTLNIHIDDRHSDVVWPNLPLYLEGSQPNVHMVAVLSALNKHTIMIDDVYDNRDFDFTGAKAFDKNTGYRSRSMLVVPLLDHEEEVIGVLQLINKRDKRGKTITFDEQDKESTQALASQASVAIINNNLLKGLEESFELFIRTIAKAIDTKSHHTGEHVRRVAKIADMIAKAIDKSDEGIYKKIDYSENDLRQIHLAALLHDVGKIATPEHIMDKSNKLETIVDRIELIDERVEILKRDVRIKYLEDELDALRSGRPVSEDMRESETLELAELDTMRLFLRKTNVGSEFLADDKIEYLHRLAKIDYRLDGVDTSFLRDDELRNLSIRKGTLTDEERDIIIDHARVTVEILSAIPFPKALQRVPDIACNHHERLDGSGYPRQLKGDELSLEDRILVLADLFEALSASNRSYRKANSMSEIASIIETIVGLGHIDSELVTFFFETGIYREYAQSELNPSQQEHVKLNLK